MPNGLPLYENEYLRVFGVRMSDRESGRYRVHVRATRKDTDEYMNYGFVVSGVEPESVLATARARVDNELAPVLDRMMPPPDWNKDVRKVLRSILRYINRREDFGSFIGKLLKEGGDVEAFHERNAAFQRDVLYSAISIAEAVAKLPSEDRLSLLTLSDDLLSDPLTGYSFFEIDARLLSIEFFMSPTAQERAEHERQKTRLEERYASLG